MSSKETKKGGYQHIEKGYRPRRPTESQREKPPKGGTGESSGNSGSKK